MEQANSILDSIPASRETAKIKGVMVVEIPVADMRQAVEFYVGQLGFYIDLEKNPPSKWGTDTEMFVKPAAGIHLMLQQTDGKERLGFSLKGEPRPFLVLEIEEPAQVVWSRLRENGVKVGELEDRGGCGIGFPVWDVDGNVLRLHYQPR
ncbi:hypothetical protein J31TS4_19520 [Paenibacillus sp. J31TS4]|uniref:VOC family protein n=1 Tax=Paenibacillus sp. J31TS4 TaxID=2807195 RepID=UPI001B0EC44F|nr:VOC family protein [Paenibacillus sp. J31TS4]GIP38672.1 hypothetical protein J31TS4_19520 [Paenibacillus sp. J31TS4]